MEPFVKFRFKLVLHVPKPHLGYELGHSRCMRIARLRMGVFVYCSSQKWSL